MAINFQYEYHNSFHLLADWDAKGRRIMYLFHNPVNTIFSKLTTTDMIINDKSTRLNNHCFCWSCWSFQFSSDQLSLSKWSHFPFPFWLALAFFIIILKLLFIFLSAKEKNSINLLFRLYWKIYGDTRLIRTSLPRNFEESDTITRWSGSVDDDDLFTCFLWTSWRHGKLKWFSF